MNLRSASVALALAAVLTFGACAEDQPTGNNNIDPTMPTNPCDSTKTGVISNGFVMSGSGYQGQPVNFTDFRRSLQFDECGPDCASITFSILDTVPLADDPAAEVIVDMHLPSFKPATYPFNKLAGDSASYLRVELRRRGTATKVYRSLEGRFVLDSLIEGARAYGRYCGVLQDSVSRSQIAIMGGRFSASE